jgi:hypothetical protein
MGYLTDPTIFPMTYTIAEAYVKNLFTTMSQRELEIVCTLRGSNSDPVRLRVRQWVEEYAKARGVKNYVAGQINSASRTIVSTGYFDQMYKARIIVTSNPSGWEGGAPSIISTETSEFDLTMYRFSPDGSLRFWGSYHG